MKLSLESNFIDLDVRSKSGFKEILEGIKNLLGGCAIYLI